MGKLSLAVIDQPLHKNCSNNLHMPRKFKHPIHRQLPWPKPYTTYSQRHNSLLPSSQFFNRLIIPAARTANTLHTGPIVG